MPELRGTVVEYGTNTPIAAAEVILYEFVTIDGLYTRKQVASVITDPRGAFTLKPEHPGNFYIEAKKQTYLTAEQEDSLGPITGTHLAETLLNIARDPIPPIHFILIRPGGITGRVIDEDGKPVPNFTLTTAVPGVPQWLAAKATTGRDGVFTFQTLVPVPRVIRAGPEDSRTLALNFKFKPEDIDKVVDDISTTYWPGGTSDPALALPFDIIPGNIANAGTIQIRKAPYYRAHLTFGDECKAVNFAQAQVGGFMAAFGCNKEVLIEKLSPGSYNLVLWVNAAEPTQVAEWALASFTIDRKNVEVPVVFSRSIDIEGRVVNASGGRLPALGNAAVRLTTELGFSGRPLDAKPGEDGRFVIHNAAWPRHRVFYEPLAPGLAIKEIRYNNQPSPDGFINISAGAPLEIVVDDNPAVITGSAPPGSRIYAARWPSTGVAAAPYLLVTAADASGSFRVGSLAAGEYRAIAVPSATPFIEPPILVRLLAASSKITLDRGTQHAVELKLSDPSR